MIRGLQQGTRLKSCTETASRPFETQNFVHVLLATERTKYEAMTQQAMRRAKLQATKLHLFKLAADVAPNEQSFACGRLRSWTFQLGNHVPVADFTQEERRLPHGVGGFETGERPPPCNNEDEPFYLNGIETRPPPTSMDHQIQQQALPATHVERGTSCSPYIPAQ